LLGEGTRAAYDLMRERIPAIETDTVMAPLLDAAVQLVRSGELVARLRHIIDGDTV
jgi:histidine ammonia-lyase